MTLDFSFIYNTGMNVLQLGNTLWNFLSYEIEVSGVGSFEVYELLFGTGLVVIVVMMFVKKVVPFL